jgi:hypothetical protein
MIWALSRAFSRDTVSISSVLDASMSHMSEKEVTGVSHNLEISVKNRPAFIPL